ncbi:M13 family metallopeptidase [Sphingomonas crusticola]|uniref:M13 family metallopeptidase n=1 Tax=Sphingomonas crusticola TaxID=1697973 RepID=UPI001F085995|nr:M13 family metallopeptidase [Sphingomonas crusticola]
MVSKSLFLLAASMFALSAAVAAPPAENAKKPVGAAVGPVASQQAALGADKPQIGTFGFDEAGMDRSVAPGDDFYAFANGTWTKVTEIPADRSNYGAFAVLDDLSVSRTRGILDAAAKDPNSKIGALYTSFMDEDAIEAKGFDPIKSDIAAIKGIGSKSDYARALGLALRNGVRGPIAAYVSLDDKDPDRPTIQVAQSGLGLPDRDYYLKTDAPIVAARKAYVDYLTQLFSLTGEPNGAARAQAIVDFEGRLAQIHWTRVESRDSDKTYNVWTRADFDKNAPGFDWAAYLGAAGLNGDNHYLVAQPSAVIASAKLIADAPLPLLKDYLLAHTIDEAAPWLSRRFVDANFGFEGTTLSGTPQNQARWKRGVDLVKNAMGEDVGQAYVAKYFPPETKAAADRLVKNIIAAMDRRLQTLAWMDPATRQQARAKLAAFTPKIGYPDHWRDYSGLTVARDDLYGNVKRSNEFDWQYGLSKLGKPADRREWGMTPMEINAYANPVWNEIVFPAAILQPPFFDPHADPAVNYGGIGAVIGHELSHHFDDQGRKYDKTGRLTDWWTPQDVTRFTALTDKLVKEYDAYEPLPGMHVQGALTLGENMADLAGLTVALDAYHASLNGKPAPVIDGMTGDQRFYLGWAQVWRRSYREANLRQRLLTDPHSPSVQRTWIVRNLQPWYDAYKPVPTAKMYLTPEQRVLVW